MKSNLIRLSLFLAICLVCVSTAMASPACPSPSNWGAYLTTTSCAIDNLTFSQFGFNSGGTLAPTAASIGVVVQDPAVTPGLDGPGFNFDPAFNVASGQTADAALTFKVTAAAGINDLLIFFNGAFTGSGSTMFSETYCTGSFTSGCHDFEVSSPGPGLSDLISIPSATTLYITKDFGVSGGPNGSASISSVTNEFSSPVPEPGQIGLLILAMVGIVFASRRIKASAN